MCVQRSQEHVWIRYGLPDRASPGHERVQALAAQDAFVQARHVCLGSGFVDKDKALRVNCSSSQVRSLVSQILPMGLASALPTARNLADYLVAAEMLTPNSVPPNFPPMSQSRTRPTRPSRRRRHRRRQPW